MVYLLIFFFNLFVATMAPIQKDIGSYVTVFAINPTMCKKKKTCINGALILAVRGSCVCS